MYAIVTDQASAEACRDAVDESFGLPVEGVNHEGGGDYASPGDFRRVTKHFADVQKHTTRDEYAYPIVDANESRFDEIKAAAIAAGDSGTPAQKLISATPSKSTLTSSWFPDD